MSGEKEYLKSYDKEMYEKPSVTVDLLVFTIVDDRLKIVLVKREEYPFKDMLALPGVFVNIDETLDGAAKRGIKEEAGITDIYFEQLYTWGDVNRDPRMRIISVSYLSLTPSEKIQLSIGQRTSSMWKNFLRRMQNLHLIIRRLSNTEESALKTRQNIRRLHSNF